MFDSRLNHILRFIIVYIKVGLIDSCSFRFNHTYHNILFIFSAFNSTINRHTSGEYFSHIYKFNNLPYSNTLLFTVEIPMMLLKKGTWRFFGGKNDFIVITTYPD